MKYVIKGRLPGRNEFDNGNRANRYMGAQKKKEAQAEVVRQLKTQGYGRTIPFKVDIELFFVEPNMRRDPDNILAGAIKVLLDAMVECGILANDTMKQVGNIYARYAVNKSNPRIEVTLRRSQE